jgi:hypothetical protein
MAVPPTLSVVVVVLIGPTRLLELLVALDAQRSADTEIIVACDSLIGDVSEFRDRFPAIEFIWFEGKRTPAELRAAAVARAHGRIVALVEDHCVPAPNWCTEMVAAHSVTAPVVGGAIEKGFRPGKRDDTTLNWAVYLADYSRYMLQADAGPGHGASDCNGSYKRAVLDEIAEHWRHQFHENVVNAVLRERGYTAWFAPSVVVHEQRDLTWRGALHDRYAFGRLFGSTRVAGASLARRAMMSAGAMLLPPLLVLRVARNVFGRRRYRLQFLRAAIPLAIVAGAWVAGELLGYITGTAERTLAGRRPRSGGPVVAELE